jgi:hypothetical protein
VALSKARPHGLVVAEKQTQTGNVRRNIWSFYSACSFACRVGRSGLYACVMKVLAEPFERCTLQLKRANMIMRASSDLRAFGGCLGGKRR